MSRSFLLSSQPLRQTRQTNGIHPYGTN
jgi:hypothetical protein